MVRALAIDGRTHLSSPPATRAWCAHLVAQPRSTTHLENGIRADLPATAVPVTEETGRRRLLTEVVAVPDQPGVRALFGRPASIDALVAGSPLVEVRSS